MLPLPHHYHANARSKGNYVEVSSAGLPSLATSAPPDFGGPEDYWSPETLLVGAIADCYILTFKAIATAAKLEWVNIQCEVVGTLDRVDRGMEFIHFDIVGKVQLVPGQNESAALKLLEKSEANCLVSRSLKADISFSGLVVPEL
tara:strand:+ start:5007 stop:5441 length:435 start_codon:yes stop_codon:yes gene_type:complete